MMVQPRISFSRNSGQKRRSSLSDRLTRLGCVQVEFLRSLDLASKYENASQYSPTQNLESCRELKALTTLSSNHQQIYVNIESEIVKPLVKSPREEVNPLYNYNPALTRIPPNRSFSQLFVNLGIRVSSDWSVCGNSSSDDDRFKSPRRSPRHDHSIKSGCLSPQRKLLDDFKKKFDETCDQNNPRAPPNIFKIDVCSTIGQALLRERAGRLLNTGKLHELRNLDDALITRRRLFKILPSERYCVDKKCEQKETLDDVEAYGLRTRLFPITYRRKQPLSELNHRYRFLRSEKAEFCRAFDAGLSVRSWRIKCRTKKCSVRVQRLVMDSSMFRGLCWKAKHDKLMLRPYVRLMHLNGLHDQVMKCKVLLNKINSDSESEKHVHVDPRESPVKLQSSSLNEINDSPIMAGNSSVEECRAAVFRPVGGKLQQLENSSDRITESFDLKPAFLSSVNSEFTTEYISDTLSIAQIKKEFDLRLDNDEYSSDCSGPKRPRVQIMRFPKRTKINTNELNRRQSLPRKCTIKTTIIDPVKMHPLPCDDKIAASSGNRMAVSSGDKMIMSDIEFIRSVIGEKSLNVSGRYINCDNLCNNNDAGVKHCDVLHQRYSNNNRPDRPVSGTNLSSLSSYQYNVMSIKVEPHSDMLISESWLDPEISVNVAIPLSRILKTEKWGDMVTGDYGCAVSSIQHNKGLLVCKDMHNGKLHRCLSGTHAAAAAPAFASLNNTSVTSDINASAACEYCASSSQHLLTRLRSCRMHRLMDKFAPDLSVSSQASSASSSSTSCGISVPIKLEQFVTCSSDNTDASCWSSGTSARYDLRLDVGPVLSHKNDSSIRRRRKCVAMLEQPIERDVLVVESVAPRRI